MASVGSSSTGDQNSLASGPDLAPGEGDAGKFLFLQVPNYNCGRGGTGPLGSYIRLGAIQSSAYAGSPSAPPATGEDLASSITSFIDDTRLDDGCPDFVPPGERQAETAKLHTKGGIRMHTDGNMVQTVRGDYGVVVGGNYKMVVMCRDLAGQKTASVDMSGGHVSEGGITFQGSSSIEYTTGEYGGTWMVFEETHKAHVSSTFHGRTFERYAGEIVDTVTGSEAPTVDWPNPVVSEATWATSITSSTGSAALPVPTIVNSTFATELSSVTEATAMSDTTMATTISSSTTAAAMSDVTTAGAMESTTVAGTISSTTTASVVNSVTIGNTIDTTIGNTVSTTVGTATSTTVGNMFQAVVGAQENINLAATLNLTIGLIVDLCLAGKLSVDLGARTEITAGPRTTLTIDKTGIHGERTDLAGDVTEVSGMRECIAAMTIFL